MDDDIRIGGFIFGLVLMGLVWLLVHSVTASRLTLMQDEAVRRGYAAYVVNQDKEVEFLWVAKEPTDDQDTKGEK